MTTTITVNKITKPVHKHLTLDKKVDAKIVALAKSFKVPQSQLINSLCATALEAHTITKTTGTTKTATRKTK